MTEIVGAEVLAAGGIGAAVMAGKFAGKATGKPLLRTTVDAVLTVGRFGGAYTAAGTQAAGRWIAARISDSRRTAGHPVGGWRDDVPQVHRTHA